MSTPPNRAPKDGYFFEGRFVPRYPEKKKKTEEDEDSDAEDHLTSSQVAIIGLKVATRMLLTAATVLYILNQKHLLPKPLSRAVSKHLFWPTLPITMGKRIGKWTTVVDDTVVMGGIPVGFMGIPQYLKKEYGITGIVNMCDEYCGNTQLYEQLGIEELWLRTIDHWEPKVDQLEEAVNFIEDCKRNGSRVYIHCKAGHGRSAAVTFAWLLSQNPDADPELLNKQLCSLRDVRPNLWKQANIRKFHDRIIKKSKTNIFSRKNNNDNVEAKISSIIDRESKTKKSGNSEQVVGDTFSQEDDDDDDWSEDLLDEWIDESSSSENNGDGFEDPRISSIEKDSYTRRYFDQDSEF